MRLSRIQILVVAPAHLSVVRSALQVAGELAKKQAKAKDTGEAAKMRASAVEHLGEQAQKLIDAHLLLGKSSELNVKETTAEIQERLLGTLNTPHSKMSKEDVDREVKTSLAAYVPKPGATAEEKAVLEKNRAEAEKRVREDIDKKASTKEGESVLAADLEEALVLLEKSTSTTEPSEEVRKQLNMPVPLPPPPAPEPVPVEAASAKSK